MRNTWSYGITTVPSRRTDLLPRTLASLALSGFDTPHLFIDGATPREAMKYSDQYPTLGITSHYPAMRAYGNWLTALIELVVKNPAADRYAIFQDDFVTGLNLRRYLETIQPPEKTYQNLYLFPSNEILAPRIDNGTKRKNGWYLSNQMGRGAVGLVFPRDAAIALIGTNYVTERILDANRGHRSIDGGVVEAFKTIGWKEAVHFPSLVQHTGERSSMGNKEHRLADSFRGEEFDYLSLLETVAG